MSANDEMTKGSDPGRPAGQTMTNDDIGFVMVKRVRVGA